MNKIKNYEYIVNLIKFKPMSAKEIRSKLKTISPQVINKHLKKGLRRKEIAYLGNKVKKKDTQDLLRNYYGSSGWPGKAHQIYIYTLESGRLYSKLKKKYKKKNLEIINEIVRLHQVIEVISKFQEMYAPEGTKMRRDMRRFYKERYKRINFNSTEEFTKFIKVIKMNPLMHWIAYREEKIKNEITIPMFKKMGELFVRVN